MDSNSLILVFKHRKVDHVGIFALAQVTTWMKYKSSSVIFSYSDWYLSLAQVTTWMKYKSSSLIFSYSDWYLSPCVCLKSLWYD